MNTTYAEDVIYITPDGGISDLGVVLPSIAPKAIIQADGTMIVSYASAPAPSQSRSPINETQIDEGIDNIPTNSQNDPQSKDYVNELDKMSDAYSNNTPSTSNSGPIKVYTTEKIPGAKCECAIDNRDAKDIRNGMTLESQCGDITTRRYVCIVSPGLGSFQQIFADIIRYFINITLLLGVLAIVGLGISWSLAGGDDAKAKSTLKNWAINIIVGLVILFMFQYILRFLAPWIYQ